MSLNLRDTLGQVRIFVALFASVTETKIDDVALEAIDFLLANATLLNWLQSLIDAKDSELMAGDAVALAAAAPADVAKIGDGKLLELLMKLLPLILRLI